MQMWYRAGVVGGCGWRANDDDRVAEHAYAADRFAREIVGFLKVVGGALAAADRQPVGRLSIVSLPRSSTLLYVLWLTNAVLLRKSESSVV